MSNQHVYKSIYEAIGAEKFEALVAAFYRGVQADPILKPLYPAHDMAGAEQRLRLFLIQYFGGPTTYSQERGHPRLRARHSPYRIGAAERDAWLRNMMAALDSVGIAEPIYTQIKDYFLMAAPFLVNSEE